MTAPIHSVGKSPRMSIAHLDDGLSDVRVLKVRDRLGKAMHLDEEIDFLTYIQPPADALRRGIYQRLPRAMVFMVSSPNPHPRYDTKFIKTMRAVPLEKWEALERERAVSDSDPATDIFKDLCAQHLQARREWGELN